MGNINIHNIPQKKANFRRFKNPFFGEIIFPYRDFFLEKRCGCNVFRFTDRPKTLFFAQSVTWVYQIFYLKNHGIQALLLPFLPLFLHLFLRSFFTFFFYKVKKERKKRCKNLHSWKSFIFSNCFTFFILHRKDVFV